MPAKKSLFVKIYSTSTCPYCHMAKEYLKEKGIKFKEFNVAKNDKAREEMIKKSSQMGVPVLEINDKIIVGFDRQEIEKALKKK